MLRGSTTALIVCARSWAEIPVVTPSFAAIETVNAVPCRVLSGKRDALHAGAAPAEQLVGAVLHPAGYVGVGGAAIGRVVLEAAVLRRIVRRRDDDAVREVLLAAAVSSRRKSVSRGFPCGRAARTIWRALVPDMSATFFLNLDLLRETEVRNVNGYHELLVNRRHPVVSHVSAPFCWKGDALNRNRIVDVLGGCESPGGFDVIIVAT